MNYFKNRGNFYFEENYVNMYIFLKLEMCKLGTRDVIETKFMHMNLLRDIHSIYTVSAVLTHGHVGQLPAGPHEHRDPMLIYVCCIQHVFNV